MRLYLNCHGLGFFQDDEETFGGLLKIVAQNGKEITGYYGIPYINLHFGDPQLIMRTKMSEDKKTLEVEGLDNHASGTAVWKGRIGCIDINTKNADKLSRRIMVTRPDGSGGMAIIRLVNADVLPSFMENDIVTMQMIGFPEKIEYYPDQESYMANQPECRDGSKFGLEAGNVFCSGFLQNRSPNSKYFESDEQLDDIVNICGPVKAFCNVNTQFGEKEGSTFIRCLIDTEYGPLEIDHAFDQVDEAQTSNLKKGAYVNFYGVLSGDVAIYEYEKGIVRDEEHDLAALRFMFSGNDPERIRSILAKDAVYHAEYNDAKYCGADEIIQRMKDVQEDHRENKKYYAHFATIESVDDGEDALPYEAGKRCLVLAAGDETKYESIVFIDVDDDGNILHLTTSINPRYHFRIDQKAKKKNPFDGLELPKTVVKPILLRAKFQGIVDESVTEEMLCSSMDYSDEFENNIDRILADLPQEAEKDKKRILQNVFGYLFAKAMELNYIIHQPNPNLEERKLCSYSVNDAWEGEIHSELSPELNKKLEDAKELGKQFYGDFEFFLGRQDENCYDDNLKKALIAVQILGTMYSNTVLKTE